MRRNVIKQDMPKEGLNEIALQNAIKVNGCIEYDQETPLVINSECKIVKIYEKDMEELFGCRNEEENEEMDYVIADDSENEEYSLDEIRNREHDYYDEQPEEEETSFDNLQYREVRIVFADRINNRLASNKVKYSIDIYTDMSLDEIEERLLACNSEDEIEELQAD